MINSFIERSPCKDCSCTSSVCGCPYSCFNGLVTFSYYYVASLNATLLVIYQEKYQVDVQTFLDQNYYNGKIVDCYLNPTTKAIRLNQYAIDLQQLLIWSIVLWCLGGIVIALWLTIELSRLYCVKCYKVFNIPNDVLHTEYNV